MFFVSGKRGHDLLRETKTNSVKKDEEDQTLKTTIT